MHASAEHITAEGTKASTESASEVVGAMGQIPLLNDPRQGRNPHQWPCRCPPADRSSQQCCPHVRRRVDALLLGVRLRETIPNAFSKRAQVEPPHCILVKRFAVAHVGISSLLLSMMRSADSEQKFAGRRNHPRRRRSGRRWWRRTSWSTWRAWQAAPAPGDGQRRRRWARG